MNDMKTALDLNELEQAVGGRSASTQTFTCQYCGKVFTTRKERDNHEQECEQNTTQHTADSRLHL